MRARFNIFIALSALCLILTACSERRGQVTVRIVATTDVHGNIFDTDFVDGSERKGSLAKFSTFLKQQRKDYRNVIYLDAGDILQGSIEVYQDVTAQFYRESLPAKAYSQLGCDAMAMGNHDLAVGAPSFERFFRGMTFPALGANLYFEQYGDYIPPYIIIEKQGLRIAVIGMTTPVVAYSLPPDRNIGLNVADIVDAAKYWMPILVEQEQADVVIGLIHSGWNNGRMDRDEVYENSVRRLLSEVPGFDLIICGHDHVSRCLKTVDCSGDSVLVLNPGPYAGKAAVVTLQASFKESGKPTILTSGSLEDITCVEPDKAFMKRLSGWYDDVKHYSDSIIGVTSAPLDGRNVLWGESSVMDYVHSIQMGFHAAQISLSSPVFSKVYFEAGEMPIRDMFKLYRYDNTMVAVMMKGSEVKDILEYSASQFYNTVTDGSGGMLKLRKDPVSGANIPRASLNGLITAAGICYEIDVTKPAGKRVNILSMADGGKFDPDKYYRTTINSFLYSGAESAVFKATDISLKNFSERFNTASTADIRYYILTNFALKHEMDSKVKVETLSNWRLVPEQVVSECLAKDTIHFSIIP